MRNKAKILFIALSLGIFSSCASVEKVKLADEDFVGKPLVITSSVPFEEQTPELCGPTALYMAAKNLKPELTLSQVKSFTFSPGAKGSYKQDILAAARRLGMAPYSVASLHQVFDYLAEGTPVIIFHQTDFLWQNYWHFSVLTGYNKPKNTFSVHIGDSPYHDMDISQVVNTWKLGGQWAYVIMLPEALPERASFEDVLDNGLALVRLEFFDAAERLAESMLKRWPDRYEADLILADVLSKKNKSELALAALKRAYQKNPTNLVLKKKILELTAGFKTKTQPVVN